LKPESVFWQETKQKLDTFSLTRLESWASAGVPDVLGYGDKRGFFTIELKVTSSNKIRFSPHQIAFHFKHPKDSYILVKTLAPRSVKLYSGSAIQELVAYGPTLPPVAEGWDACRLSLDA
jgi:hypothetical protein